MSGSGAATELVAGMREAPGRRGWWAENRSRLQDNGIFAAVVVLLIFAALFVPNFATLDNFMAVVRREALLGAVAVGLTFIVLSGNLFDLSVPAAVALGAVISVWLTPFGLPASIAGGLLGALVLGTLNGFIVGRLKVNPVITTIGTFWLGTGALLSAKASLVTGKTQEFRDMGVAAPLGIALSIWVMVFVTIVGQLVLSRTRFGQYVYLMGANRAAARAAGVPVTAVTIAVFMLTSFLAGLSGILLAASKNAAMSSDGAGWDFAALLAVALGGTSLAGGRGNVVRTLAGVICMALLFNVLILVGAPTPTQIISKGAVILAVVGLNAWMGRRQRQ